MARRITMLLALALILAACQTNETTIVVEPTAVREPGVLAAPATANPVALPEVATRQTAIATALAADPPILLLSGLDAQAQAAQQLAVTDQRVIVLLRNQQGAPLRNEVFASRPATAADLTELTAPLCTSACYRVEIYHYAANATTVAIVDPTKQQVLTAETFANSQPNDIPKHLADLATQIAIASPEVTQEFGRKLTADEAMQAQMKTALNKTQCERAQHLCVAPTFLHGPHALWAIVDLTDLRLVGVQWTNVGTSGPPITEKTLEDQTISAQFCEQNTPLERSGWNLEYILTASDGLRISNVLFNGKPVLNSASLVDWHVNYSGEQQFGYSDAVGCPLFSSAAVAAYEPPEVKELTENGQVVGFALLQEFRHPGWPGPCQYYYVQQYNFYNDGRFRTIAQSNGRGCGDDGTYRPVWRIALAGERHSVAAWDGANWQPWTTEQWAAQGATSPEGYKLRITTPSGGDWYVAPGKGGNAEERGDTAFLYATVAKSAEGETDLPTIGSCCNIDYHQGPEKFIEPNPEPLGNSPAVLWYVSQMKNDDTPGAEYCWATSVAEGGVYVPRVWPCVSGPTFVPIISQ